MLTAAQRALVTEAVDAYHLVDSRLRDLYGENFFLEGHLVEQVVNARDLLLELSAHVAGLGINPPYETVRQVAPLVSGLDAYCVALTSPIHGRVAQRYSGYMGPEYIVFLIRDFQSKHRRVLGIPGMADAVRRDRTQARREHARRNAPPPRGEYRVPGQAPIRVGELSPPFQVTAIEDWATSRQRGQIIAVRLDTNEVVRFTPASWIKHRQISAVAQRLLPLFTENPVAQFAYGFAEGVGGEMQGTLELLGHLREALSKLADLILRLPGEFWELAQQVLEAILDWGRRFAAADAPRRARMAGRVLGALFFEIVSSIATAGLATALKEVMVGLRRVESLHGVFTLVDRASDAARVVQRATRRVLSPAARRLLRARRVVTAEYQQFLRSAFVVADGVLEVGGEFVRGTIRRVVRAGETVLVFVVEGGDRLMVRLGPQLEELRDFAVWATGPICARP